MFRGFVVEESAPVRAALVEGLAELAGVTTVGCAGDERKALAWLTDPANDWDIAIVDPRLGGGSGYGVLEALCRRQPHQRVVAWTAAADPRATSRCVELGVDRVFDRATENSLLMEYCMAQAEAQALAAVSSGSFPSATPRVEPLRSSFAALFGA